MTRLRNYIIRIRKRVWIDQDFVVLATTVRDAKERALDTAMNENHANSYFESGKHVTYEVLGQTEFSHQVIQ